MKSSGLGKTMDFEQGRQILPTENAGQIEWSGFQLSFIWRSYISIKKGKHGEISDRGCILIDRIMIGPYTIIQPALFKLATQLIIHILAQEYKRVA